MILRAALRCASITFIAAAVCVASADDTASNPGLHIGPEGVILKSGAPIRAFGVNYMSAFTRCLDNPDNTSYREGFKTLAAHGIPFARLNFGGFFPSDWTLYRQDPDRYFALMDGVVHAAEEFGIGLIPSLFWWSPCVPDIVGEPRNQWGNPESKTIAFMRTYTQQVVSRYVNSPAIWAWEFGNEYSLAADLPNADTHRPPTPVSKGCPPDRGPDDDLTSDMVNAAMRVFAEAVRAVDTGRPITTGNSLPRPSAHHQRLDGTWAQDSPAEFRDNLIFMTPSPVDLASIHIYPHAQDKRFGEDSVSYAGILSEASAAARQAGKGLFVGEFGPPPDNEEPWTPETAREEGMRLMEALEKSGVQLAALWVFDFPYQDASLNVSADNHRSGYLQALGDANKRMAAGTGN